MSVFSPQNAILAAWRETLVRGAGRPAIYGPDGRVLRSFGEIEAEAEECGRLFDGLAPGSVVGLQLGNSPRWPALLLALFAARLVPLPLGRHVEKEELEGVLELCGAAALVEAPEENLALKWRRAAGNAAPALHAEFLKLTSGTTSGPRLVRFTAGQLAADCAQICATMGIGPEDLNFGVIPFSHSYGFSNLITPLLCRGVALVASDDRMPRAMLNGLAQTGATVFPAMPVFLQKFVELQDVPALPRLRLCISAGAPLPAAVGERFTARYGIRVHTFYGASECGGIAYDAREDGPYEDGAVGEPMQGVGVEGFADGRIAVKSGAVGEGYFPADDGGGLGRGCFVPGDLVEQRPGGLFIVGRVSDVINVAGRKLHPAEVEQRLLEYPGVRQAVLFGIPSALRGEEPVACVAGEGVDAAGLMRFCHERLSQWQVPRRIWLVPAIAVNERGKVSRRQLAAQYLAGAGAQP